MEQTNIRLRPFKLKDTTELIQWGKHEDPRFFHYNFPYTKPGDLERWHSAKKSFLKRWIYAVDYNGRVVGYVTLKNVNWLEGRGEMGIALDPKCLDKGIGKRAICLYLHRVFRNFPLIDEVYLKTSEFNTRAITCYEHIGFKHVKKEKELFEEQSFKMEILKKFPDFEHDKKKLYVNYCYMRVKKTEFINRYIKNTEQG